MKRVFKESELPEIADILLTQIPLAKESGEASVIALTGELGAGKTTFTRILLEKIGSKQKTQSPTFVLMKTFPITYKGYTKFVHVDAYRLKNEQELLNLGFALLLKDPQTIIVIEWPERVLALIPQKALRVTLSHSALHEREIEFK